jgi:CheY-like chemotaxis protein
MPLMDGFEAARRIRSSGISGAAETLILAITADTGADIYARCMDAGMNDHLGKPVEREELLDLITRHLK